MPVHESTWQYVAESFLQQPTTHGSKFPITTSTASPEEQLLLRFKTNEYHDDGDEQAYGQRVIAVAFTCQPQDQKMWPLRL